MTIDGNQSLTEKELFINTIKQYRTNNVKEISFYLKDLMEMYCGDNIDNAFKAKDKFHTFIITLKAYTYLSEEEGEEVINNMIRFYSNLPAYLNLSIKISESYTKEFIKNVQEAIDYYNTLLVLAIYDVEVNNAKDTSIIRQLCLKHLNDIYKIKIFVSNEINIPSLKISTIEFDDILNGKYDIKLNFKK